MSFPEEALSFTELLTEPDILADVDTLPTEQGIFFPWRDELNVSGHGKT
jgi:hypothetical protein